MSSNIPTAPSTSSILGTPPSNAGSSTNAFFSSTTPNFNGSTSIPQTASSTTSVVPTSIFPKHHSTSTATIAGSAVAGAVVILFIIAKLLYLHRRRANRNRNARACAHQRKFEGMDMRGPADYIQPYVLEPSTQTSTTRSSLAVGHNPKSRQHPDSLVLRGSGTQDIETQSDILPSQMQLAAQLAFLQQQVLRLQMQNDPDNYVRSLASAEAPPRYVLESSTRNVASVDELHEV